MAKRKTKAEQAEPTTETQPEAVVAHGDAYEAPADLQPTMEAGSPHTNAAQGKGHHTSEYPQGWMRRQARKLRVMMGRYFGDGSKIELIDDFNGGGAAIKMTFADEADRPTPEMLAVLKEEIGKATPMQYAKKRPKEWQKDIGEHADARVATAIRLNTEDRFERVGDLMEGKKHAAKVKERRDDSHDHGPDIPF